MKKLHNLSIKLKIHLQNKLLQTIKKQSNPKMQQQYQNIVRRIKDEPINPQKIFYIFFCLSNRRRQ